MTNAEKFKTAEERFREFKKFCSKNYCEDCSCKGTTGYSASMKCLLKWLELEHKEKVVELKSCPFCGSTPVMADNIESMKSLSYYVKCVCGARFASALSGSAAAEMWNRRVK